MSIDTEPELPAMVEYIFGVLEALGIQNGAIPPGDAQQRASPPLTPALTLALPAPPPSPSPPPLPPPSRSPPP